MLGFKRVFSRAVSDVSMSIRITSETKNAIDQLADEVGVTPNAYIGLALDVFLQQKAEAGEIPWPKGHEKNGRKSK